HRALAGVYLTWSDALAGDPKSDAGAWLSLVESGLRHDPGHPGLLARLGSVALKGGPEAERARATLRRLLADGRAAATAHYLRGPDAWQYARPGAARVHWEQAHRLAPELTPVTNNLAWALASGPGPDLPRALGLIDQALARAPGDPNLRGTRGRVLARMNRFG